MTPTPYFWWSVSRPARLLRKLATLLGAALTLAVTAAMLVALGAAVLNALAR